VDRSILDEDNNGPLVQEDEIRARVTLIIHPDQPEKQPDPDGRYLPPPA